VVSHLNRGALEQAADAARRLNLPIVAGGEPEPATAAIS
jgi:hypothetical protein